MYRSTYSIYVATSVIALGVDLMLFLALQHSALAVGWVSAISYSCGVAVHWLLSTKMVFRNAVHAQRRRRHRQQMLFVLSALLGLLITVAIVSVATLVGIDARLAKLVAVVVSFQSVYILRARIVFA